MSVPVATERKSFLPLRLRPSGGIAPHPTVPMPSVSDNNNKSSLTVGNRVLVNGLKSGTLRYIGSVQFAPGYSVFSMRTKSWSFVPREKVALDSRARAATSQKPVSRLKPPTMTRSVTLTSSMNKIDQPKSVQLPDIVPNSAPQPVTLNESIVNDHPAVILSTAEPTTTIESQAIPVDEPSETIDADFTDSVSLILRQLQQEEKSERHPSSITISEIDTDDDEIDTESVVESVVDQTRRSSVASSVFIPADSSKSIQTDLSFQANENISFTKVQLPTPMEKKKPIVQPVKKTTNPRPVAPVVTPAKRPIVRKPAIVPAKKGSITKTQLNPAQSVVSLPTQSKLSLSLSSCHSLNSSQSDVALIQPISDKPPPPPAPDKSHEYEQLKENYRHLLNRFDLMFILNQYHLTQNEQIKQEHQLHLVKARTHNDRLQNSIDQLRSSHHHELSSLENEHQNQLAMLEKSHEQQSKQVQGEIDRLMHEKTALECRCASLQEKVDGFLTEMANSEHADVLLCHVETLEKDRTSLQTVLDLKNKEITQLRTKVNEQEMKLTDEQALQKRMIMAENRVQDLEWLLREKQLSEKAAVVERDELKERTTQLERDNRQLKFENETLHYRLQDRPSPAESIPPIASIPPPPPPPPNRSTRRPRSSSLSLPLATTSSENERTTRSLSLDR